MPKQKNPQLIRLFSRPYTVQYTEEAIRLQGIDCSVQEEKNQTSCSDQKKFNKFKKDLLKKYTPHKEVRSLINALHVEGNKYTALTKQITSFNLFELKNSELIKYYRDYTKQLNKYTAIIWKIYLVNDYHSQEAEKILQNKKVTTQAYQALFSPIKKCGIILLEDRLNKAKSKKEILKIAKNYLWMPCLDINTNPWTENDIIKFHKNLKKESKKISYSKAIKLAGLTSSEKKLFDLVRELTYAKDIRDVYRRQGIYNILPFFKEMAKRLKINRTDLSYLTSLEIINSLEGKTKVNKKEIKARKKRFLIYWKNKKITVTTNKKQIKNFKKNIITEKQSQGIIASKGKAKGRAKIILNIKDLHKIKKGDIMIAVTTHPDFVPAMKKAVTIITDEGGMTCHAAIISRELGIPCLVGTKNATKTFKDGDLLEIDTTRGLIKKN